MGPLFQQGPIVRLSYLRRDYKMSLFDTTSGLGVAEQEALIHK